MRRLKIVGRDIFVALMGDSNGEDVNGETDPFLYYRKIKEKDVKNALGKIKIE